MSDGVTQAISGARSHKDADQVVAKYLSPRGRRMRAPFTCSSGKSAACPEKGGATHEVKILWFSSFSNW